jgi:TolA-binding protein
VSEVGRTLLLLAAVAAGYAVVYFVLKKKIARTLAAATVLREVREEVNRILVELNQTTHRNVTLLEDRIASLAELLAKTDKKIALASREAEKQDLADRLYTELADRRRRPAEPGSTPTGMSARRPAPATPGFAEPEREAATPGQGPAAEDRQAEAVRLAQAGLSPSLISRRLGLPLGEVELILSLAEHKR